ncbi:MAG TPA: UDP-N-acetylmuramate dehydrogenase [Chryseosolibacter sp.]|nr:UDP-N-acetylmuramate dehydrogenase [Chryseosolibacter sp.]
MTIQENIDLLPYNTFNLSAHARYFTIVSDPGELQQVLASEIFRTNPFLILGGGSNVLLTKDFPGLVIKNEIKGIEIIDETPDNVRLKVGSGEPWHKFVMYAVDRNYGGIENLSLIPGTCGAAPMQNIGAYGVEVKDVIQQVETVDLETGTVRTFGNKECEFGYRESIFKHSLKGKVFISSITLTLTKRNHHFNISYGAIKDVLKENGNAEVTVKSVSDAVISIRRSKLPDPTVIGNAGSFFKNPSITESAFNKLKEKFPAIPSFPGENGLIKIPAAWLIEQNGWKGKTFFNIGVHKNQALVLVNYGGGEGRKIWELAREIRSSVIDKFNIELQPEVNVI